VAQRRPEEVEVARIRRLGGAAKSAAQKGLDPVEGEVDPVKDGLDPVDSASGARR
jgi:hypothetical protein